MGVNDLLNRGKAHADSFRGSGAGGSVEQIEYFILLFARDAWTVVVYGQPHAVHSLGTSNVYPCLGKFYGVGDEVLDNPL